MALEVIRIENYPVNSNCLLIFDRDVNSECLIVDPGSKDPSLIDSKVVELDLYPKYLILTHEHFDHIWSCSFFMNKYDATIICSSLCSELIGSAKKNLSLYYDNSPFIVEGKMTETEAINNLLKWNSHKILFVPAPGHTQAGICFTIGKYLFTGDTLLKDIKTITKLLAGSKTDLLNTLAKIESFKGENYIVCPGHGEMFDLDTYNLKTVI